MGQICVALKDFEGEENEVSVAFVYICVHVNVLNHMSYLSVLSNSSIFL